MGTIASAIGSIKAAGDIAKAITGLRDAQTIQAKVIELQQVILSAQTSALAAQSDQFTLLQQIRELEAKMAKLEAWEAEKKRYQLRDFGGRTFAYELKPQEANGEPIHRICANCYQKGHKSILQFSARSSGQDYYDCHECKTRPAFGVYSSSSDYDNRGYDD
jgi:hypothetical protein